MLCAEVHFKKWLPLHRRVWGHSLQCNAMQAAMQSIAVLSSWVNLVYLQIPSIYMSGLIVFSATRWSAFQEVACIWKFEGIHCRCLLLFWARMQAARRAVTSPVLAPTKPHVSFFPTEESSSLNCTSNHWTASSISRQEDALHWELCWKNMSNKKWSWTHHHCN